MSTAERLLTADEFDELEEPEDGGKLELDEGLLVRHMPVNADHGIVQISIGAALRAFVREHEPGSVMVENAYRLTVPGTRADVVRAPDVSVVSRALSDEERRAPALAFAPALAVEVISPSDRDIAVQRKVRQYLAAGVERVWVVRPDERTVTVHKQGGDAHTYAGDDVLTSEDAGFGSTGFRLPIAGGFAG